MAQGLAIESPLDGIGRHAASMHRKLRRLVRANPVRAAGVGSVAVVGLVALGVSQAPIFAPQAEAAPPSVVPMTVKAIAPTDAEKINAATPLTATPAGAAAPFRMAGTSQSRAQATDCLASAIYYEAGNQDEAGARAVAQVVLNRVRHPAFPSSVCGVVYQGSTRSHGCQFTFTCDGSLARAPDPAGWRRARMLAEQALSGIVFAPVGWATHYHANYVVPTWISSMAKSAVVGAHLFYRWNGAWGQPEVFTQAYSGHEASAAGLRSAALAAEARYPTPSDSEGALIAAIPGTEPLKFTPSMRGDKRVAVRFTQVARKASDEAVHEDYSEKFAASDNLRWSLSSEGTSSTEAPLGESSSR
jgi:spore germination cell wall hydrolase CwlJ-like protein